MLKRSVSVLVTGALVCVATAASTQQPTCGRSTSAWRKKHVDHAIPTPLGGSNGPENIVITCAACNLSKGSKLPHEFSDRLC